MIQILSIVTIIISAELSIAQSACPAGDYDREFFDNLKNTDFKAQQNITDDTLALVLSDCLGHSDSEIRDGIAFEGLVALLRGGRVSDQGKRELLAKCAGALAQEAPDGEGFIKPFSALCVAEVARTDRVEAYFSAPERQEIVEIGTNYLKSITDYRGFDEVDGWRHGVAHTADVLMQLSLNDNVGVELYREMLGAIESQLSPSGHFYTYGEPARLARPVLFMAMHGTIDEQEWTEWFNTIVKPGPELGDWSQVFSSQAGLIKRHNVSAFLSALYLNASASNDENVKAMIPGLNAALREVP